MEMIDLDRLEAVAKRATPGTWHLVQIHGQLGECISSVRARDPVDSSLIVEICKPHNFRAMAMAMAMALAMAMAMAFLVTFNSGREYSWVYQTDLTT